MFSKEEMYKILLDRVKKLEKGLVSDEARELDGIVALVEEIRRATNV